jgi:hypothetical protein
MTPVLYPNCVLDPITAADTDSASTRCPGKRGKARWATGCDVTLIACKKKNTNFFILHCMLFITGSVERNIIDHGLAKFLCDIKY